ncbi:hypothetical protein BCLUESOX_1163 [bacterium endosymbiont of Bathymodiolus sp. 5 South]|nr:hypothetical protein BCLUESOX_1163 [bacterium endosymbiont of Bathymodiolus sp. 5 South]
MFFEFCIISYLPSFWWKICYFMGFINYIGLMQGGLYQVSLTN